MKKKVNWLFRFLAILAFLFSTGFTSVFAATDNSTNTWENSMVVEEQDTHIHDTKGIQSIGTIDGSIIQPMYVACSGGGKHTMQGNARGDVISPSGAYLLRNAYCFRCTKCGLVIISENSPILGATYLGRYATGSGSVAYHTYMYVHYTSYSQLPYNSRLGGDTFTQSLSWVY
ncbi:MAG TPA: hypothetical protein PLD31_00990 [Streptococcus parasuis]|mgnify:FL=1|jgi:hypothetical protein|nr:hypothetical protein [Streptococcus parasuis]